MLSMIAKTAADQITREDRIIYGIAFTIAAVISACLFFFQGWRDTFRMIAPGGLAVTIIILVLIMGICAYLLG